MKPRVSEDWLAVYTGLFIFVLSLAMLFGKDILGWAITTNVWMDIGKALAPAWKAYATLPPLVSLLATFTFLSAVLGVGAKALGASVTGFLKGFTLVFFVSYMCWIAGSWADIAARSDKLKQFGFGWSLNLTAEAGFIIALVAGLAVGNFFPSLANAMKDAIRPELYIKTAIVILGGFLGVTASEQLSLATSVMFSGLCAIIVAYLVYWAVVYYIARRYFRFSREWSAP